MSDLVKFWSDFDLDQDRLIHPKDIEVLKEYFGQDVERDHENFEKFVHGKFFGKSESRFHFSLPPAPFEGDLKKADIFILLVNPGFSPLDYYCMQFDSVRKLTAGTFKQTFAHPEFPNHCLNPRYCWTGGYQWWEKKFRAVAVERANDKCHDGNYFKALKELSNRVASIELIPYHSQSFTGDKLIGKLPSSIAAQAFVHEKLVPRAEAGEIKIIITRQVKSWNIMSTSENVLKYSPGQARGAHLTISKANDEKRDRGGDAILEQLRSTDN